MNSKTNEFIARILLPISIVAECAVTEDEVSLICKLYTVNTRHDSSCDCADGSKIRRRTTHQLFFLGREPQR